MRIDEPALRITSQFERDIIVAKTIMTDNLHKKTLPDTFVIFDTARFREGFFQHLKTAGGIRITNLVGFAIEPIDFFDEIGLRVQMAIPMNDVAACFDNSALYSAVGVPVVRRSIQMKCYSRFAPADINPPNPRVTNCQPFCNRI